MLIRGKSPKVLSYAGWCFSYICSYLSMKPLFIGFQAIRLPIRGTYEVVLEHFALRSTSIKKATG